MPAHAEPPSLPRPSPAPAGRHRRAALIAAAVVASTALTVGCASLDQKQRQWIFQPSAQAWGGSAWAAEGMEDVWIRFRPAGQTHGVELHGLWLGQDDPNAPVMLYLHGARWDVRGSAHRMRRLHAMGFAVLGIDYRGFGRSTAQLPSETSSYEDARAAWNWLAERYPQQPRYVFGHSLGAAVAVHLASQADDVRGLIVEGAFTSIPDVVSTWRWGWLPVGPLITQRFDAATRITRVRVPVLVVHGSADRTIAPALGRALYERAPAPKRWLLVEGGSHHSTNTLAQPLYREALRELFGLQPP